MKDKKILMMNKIIITSVFIALCFAGTFIQIRMPAGDLVHLGNFVCLTAALLCGGVIGGLSGSLGMGLYDLLFYSNKPTTIARTFILKFAIGFIAGSLFRILIKRDRNYMKMLIGLGVGLFVLFLFTGSIVIFGDKKSSMNYSLSFTIFKQTKSLVVAIYVPIAIFLFSVLSFISAFYTRKMEKIAKAAFIAVLTAIIFNIIGEFVCRYILEGLFLSDFRVSLIVAVSKIPGSILTGIVSVLLIVPIYIPLQYAVKNISFFNNLDEFEYNNDEDVNNLKK